MVCMNTGTHTHPPARLCKESAVPWWEQRVSARAGPGALGSLGSPGRGLAYLPFLTWSEVQKVIGEAQVAQVLLRRGSVSVEQACSGFILEPVAVLLGSLEGRAGGGRRKKQCSTAAA